jgi:hypothetical protein
MLRADGFAETRIKPTLLRVLRVEKDLGKK